MPDSFGLNRIIIKMLGNSKVRFNDIRCLIIDAWAIVGVLLEQSVLLSKWGVLRAGEARAASMQLRFCLKVTPLIWLEPVPDPFPIFALKRQAAMPIATLFALRLEIT